MLSNEAWQLITYIMNKENKENSAESAPTYAPDFASEVKANPSSHQLILRELCQDGQILRNYWQSPSEEALRLAILSLIKKGIEAGQSDESLLSALKAIKATNSSACRQALEKCLQMPSGQSRAASPSIPMHWLIGKKE